MAKDRFRPLSRLVVKNPSEITNPFWDSPNKTRAHSQIGLTFHQCSDRVSVAPRQSFFMFPVTFGLLFLIVQH